MQTQWNFDEPNELIDELIETQLKEAPVTDPTILETFTPLETLTQERGKTHGRWLDHAGYSQALKVVMYRAERERRERGQEPLNPMQRESIEMIFHKIGRILAGEAGFQDHWDDIAGYATLPGKDY